MPAFEGRWGVVWVNEELRNMGSECGGLSMLCTLRVWRVDANLLQFEQRGKGTQLHLKAMWRQCSLSYPIFVFQIVFPFPFVDRWAWDEDCTARTPCLASLGATQELNLKSSCTETGAPRRSSQAYWGTLSHVTRAHCGQRHNAFSSSSNP